MSCLARSWGSAERFNSTVEGSRVSGDEGDSQKSCAFSRVSVGVDTGGRMLRRACSSERLARRSPRTLWRRAGKESTAANASTAKTAIPIFQRRLINELHSRQEQATEEIR